MDCSLEINLSFYFLICTSFLTFFNLIKIILNILQIKHRPIRVSTMNFEICNGSEMFLAKDFYNM